ncbi:MAG: hypothetical protein KF886_10775 [Candidatus Hydrogenedentes bacterium]|nr:hypothetical protein [Candidatus Hydrogenedentota bacterium]
MEILGGIGAANALVRSAASLVRAVKQPRVTDEAFSDVFRKQMDAAMSPEARRAKAAEQSDRFIGLRDADGDGMLRLDESGLDRAAFERLDLNGDGLLSREEYQQALLGETGGAAR